QIALGRVAVAVDLCAHEQRRGQRKRGTRRDPECPEQALLDRAGDQPAVLVAPAHFTSDARRSSLELITRSPRTDLRRLMLKLTRSPTRSRPTSPPSLGKSKRPDTVSTGAL